MTPTVLNDVHTRLSDVENQLRVNDQVHQLSERMLTEVRRTIEHLDSEATKYRDSVDASSKTLARTGSILGSILALAGAVIGIKSCSDAQSRIQEATKEEITKYVTKDRVQQLLDDAIRIKSEQTIVQMIYMEARSPEAAQLWSPDLTEENTLRETLANPTSSSLTMALSAVSQLAHHQRLSVSQRMSLGAPIMRLLERPVNDPKGPVDDSTRLAAIDALVAMRFQSAEPILLREVAETMHPVAWRVNAARTITKFDFQSKQRKELAKAMISIAEDADVSAADSADLLSLTYANAPNEVRESLSKTSTTSKERWAHGVMATSMNQELDESSSDTLLRALLNSEEFSFRAEPFQIVSRKEISPPALWAYYQDNDIPIVVRANTSPGNLRRLALVVADIVGSGTKEQRKQAERLLKPLITLGMYQFRFEQEIGLIGRNADMGHWRNAYALKSSNIPIDAMNVTVVAIEGNDIVATYIRPGEPNPQHVRLALTSLNKQSLIWEPRSYEVKVGVN